jgi:glutaredoxin
MVDKKHVKGKKKGDVMLYALSTCGWCKKTKRLLNELGIEYHYVDVDLVTEEHQGDVLDEVKGWNPRGTFPTLIVNDECIVGYKEEKIKEVLGA